MEWMIPLFPFIWLLIAILLLIVEAMTFNLFTIWFAIGAFVTMFVSIKVHELWAQAGVFLVVSILILVFIRNYAVKKFKSQTIKTNVNSLIGKKAMVTKKIEPYKYGEVKLDGNYWTAKPENDDIIEENTIVQVVEVSGVKLIVKKL
jgi:membrane protein implicated in regulation of membrane protease activity